MVAAIVAVLLESNDSSRGQADIGLLHRFAKAGRIKPVRVRSSRPLLFRWLNARGISKWMNIQLPLVCDHIDGDAENTSLDNFRIICNNCDSILPTFKGKNNGNGRKQRYNRTI